MKTEAKIGLLFFAGLGLMIWFALFVTGLGGGQGDYEVRFDRVNNLRIGDPVTYNGVRVGRVTDVVPVLNDLGSSEIAVHYDIDERMRQAVLIGEHTRFSISGSLLGGGGALTIDSHGAGQMPQPGLQPLRGSDPVDLNTVLSSVNQLIEENRSDLRSAIQQLPDAVGNMAGMGKEIQEVVAENRKAINEAIVGMRDMTTSIRGMVEENREEVNVAVGRLSDLLENLQGLVSENRPDIRKAIAKAPELMEEFATVGRDLRMMIQDNRERIDTIMIGFSNFAPRLDRIGADIETVTAHIAAGKGSIGKAVFEDELYDNANAAAESIRRRADEVETLTSSFATTRLYGGVETGYNSRSEVGHALAYLRIEPKPWKYYQFGIGYRGDPVWIDDELTFTSSFTVDDYRDRQESYRDGFDTLDLHAILGYRFFADNNIEKYRLDVSAGLFDGELGGRVGLQLTEDFSLWTMMRQVDDSALPNRLEREEGDVYGRATLRYEPFTGVSLRAGVDDFFNKPGPYGGLSIEIRDRDLVNLFIAAGSF